MTHRKTYSILEIARRHGMLFQKLMAHRRPA